MTEAEERKMFEEWISGPLLDMPTHRFPANLPIMGGEYCEDRVETAWQAWWKRANEEKMNKS